MGDFVHGYGMLIRGQRATPLDLAPPVHTIVEVLKAFVHAFRHNEEPPISAVDGYHAVEIAEACYESASAKEMVELDTDDTDDADDWETY